MQTARAPPGKPPPTSASSCPERERPQRPLLSCCQDRWLSQTSEWGVKTGSGFSGKDKLSNNRWRPVSGAERMTVLRDGRGLPGTSARARRPPVWNTLGQRYWSSSPPRFRLGLRWWVRNSLLTGGQVMVATLARGPHFEKHSGAVLLRHALGCGESGAAESTGSASGRCGWSRSRRRDSCGD